MNLKPSLLISLVLLVTQFAQAQIERLDVNPQTLVEPSPDVSSLGRYGSLPQSKYTGSASLSVPIYNIEFDGLTLPLSLSYNSSGLQVKNESSWIGLNWDLLSHCVISRSIRDADDLLQEINQYVGLRNGWIYQEDLGLEGKDPTQIHLPDALITAISNNTSTPKLKPDTQPDLFSVDLFGVALNFVLGKKGATDMVEGRLLNSPGYKVIFYEGNKTFEIWDNKGFKYYFTLKEYSNLFDGSFQYNIITGWFISHINSPLGNTLTFEYNSSGATTGVRTINSESRKQYEQYFYEQDACAVSGGNLTVNSPLLVTSFSENSLNYLTKIVNGREEIVFTTSARSDLQTLNSLEAKKLDAISIRYNQIEKKKITFINSYFDIDKSSDSQAYRYLRLKLDRVIKGDEVYIFEYDSPNLLPAKDSKAVDLWGYYNGKNSNTTIMPKNSAATPKGTITIGGADRDADSTYSKISMLKRVVHPTGGYSMFDYHAHKIKLEYNKYFGWERLSGATNVTSNESTTTGVYYTMNLPVTTTFSSASNSVGTLEFNLKKVGDPLDIYNAVDTYKDQVAIEFRNPSGQILKTIKYGEFNTFCYQDPNAYLCSTTDQSNYCYCYSSKSFYEGTLQAGTYTVYLKPALALSANGTSYLLYPSINVKFPSGGFRDKQVGGQRVASITDYEKDGSILSKRMFNYNDVSGYSSGKLLSTPVLSRLKMKSYRSDPGVDCYTFNCYSRLYMVEFSSSSIASPSKGLHIGYSSVAEIFTSSSVPSDNFRTSTTYNNTANAELEFMPVEPITVGVCGVVTAEYMQTYHSGLGTSYEKINGQPLLETSYNSVNSKVLEKEYTYTYSNLTRYGETVLSMRSGNNFPTVKHRIDGFRNYFMYLDTYLLTSIKTTNLTTKGNYVTTVSYSYNDKWYVKNETSINSNNLSSSVINFFPADFTITSGLINNNILSLPVRQEIITDGKLTGGVIFDYNSNGLVNKSYRYESTSLMIPEEHDPSQLLPSNYNQKVEYKYYSNGKLKQYIASDGMPVTFLWGYDNKYVVAMIKGIDYTTLNSIYIANISILNNPISESQIQEELDRLRSSLANRSLLITTYTFDPLIGISTITDSNGRRSRYTYDSQGRLATIKDHDGYTLKEYEYNFETK